MVVIIIKHHARGGDDERVSPQTSVPTHAKCHLQEVVQEEIIWALPTIPLCADFSTFRMQEKGSA